MVQGSWYQNSIQTTTITNTAPTWVTALTTSATSSATGSIYTLWYVGDVVVDDWYRWQQRNQVRQNQEQAALMGRAYRPPTEAQIAARAAANAAYNSPEQVEVRAAAARRQMDAEEQQKKDREAAKKRSDALLLEHLSPIQQETYKKNKWFVVKGGLTGTKYRIRENNGSVVANIDVYDIVEEKIIHRLCAHIPPHQVPHGDNLLAQKMMIEYDEDSFTRTANIHAAA